MLINLYNGKGTEEYRDYYAHVASIILEQKRYCDQTNVTIEYLQNVFKRKIESIVGTVRDKLQEDAKKDNLVYEVDVQAQAAADGGNAGNGSAGGKKMQ